MTKRDLLNDNVDLKNHAGKESCLRCEYTEYWLAFIPRKGELQLRLKPKISLELDVFTEETEIYDGQVRIHYRPQLSIDVVNNSAQFVLERPLHNSYIKVEGFKDNKLVAAKRMMI